MAGSTVTCVRSPGAWAVPYGVTDTYGIGYSIVVHPRVHFWIAQYSFKIMLKISWGDFEVKIKMCVALYGIRLYTGDNDQRESHLNNIQEIIEVL